MYQLYRNPAAEPMAGSTWWPRGNPIDTAGSSWTSIFEKLIEHVPGLRSQLRDGEVIVIKNNGGPDNGLAVLRVSVQLKPKITAEVIA